MYQNTHLSLLPNLLRPTTLGNTGSILQSYLPCFSVTSALSLCACSISPRIVSLILLTQCLLTLPLLQVGPLDIQYCLLKSKSHLILLAYACDSKTAIWRAYYSTDFWTLSPEFTVVLGQV